MQPADLDLFAAGFTVRGLLELPVRVRRRPPA